MFVPVSVGKMGYGNSHYQFRLIDSEVLLLIVALSDQFKLEPILAFTVL